MANDQSVSKPWNYKAGSWWKIARQTATEAMDMDVSLRCAGVAFFMFFSIFPAMAAAVSILGIIADPSAINITAPALVQNLPSDMVDLIEEQLENFASRDAQLGIGLLVSIGIALWTGSRGMNALMHAITRAHQEDKQRGFVAGALASIAFTIGAFATLAALVVVTTIIPTVLSIATFSTINESLVLWLRWPVIAALLAMAILLLFKKAPYRRDPDFTWTIPGVVISTILWLAGSWALSLYIENFGQYDVMFGSIAAAAIFMLWLYYSALILVAGAILNAKLEWHTRHDTTIGRNQPMGKRGARVADTMPEEAAD